MDKLPNCCSLNNDRCVLECNDLNNCSISDVICTFDTAPALDPSDPLVCHIEIPQFPAKINVNELEEIPTLDELLEASASDPVPSVTEQNSNKNLSYLARDKPCLYCKNTKIYLWKHEIVVEDFIKILQKKIPHLKHINNIQIIESDKAGIVKKIKIFDKKKSYIITGKDLYSLIKEIKSFIFDLKIEKNIIKINGKGYGHHRGLCQWGAHEMVKQDKSCQEVLDFYYPGTVLKKIATLS